MTTIAELGSAPGLSATALQGRSLSQQRLRELIERAKEWAILHGVVLKPADNIESTSVVEHAPMTLFPSPVPSHILQEARKLQLHFNRLMHRVAYDHEFLEAKLKNVIKVDSFTKMLWDIYKTVSHEGLYQIPESSPAKTMAAGLVKAWETYGNTSAIIVFVVQEIERNRMDQKWLEMKIFETNRNIVVKYLSLQYVADNGKLSEDKTYYIDGEEVAVFYFRSGYSPNHFTTQQLKTARLNMERSKAIKCPSVHYQLAGCKKIQQELCVPGTLERFIEDKGVVDRIRATFADQYSLDQGPEGDAAIELALESPDMFVVKPQREGGGNNFYGEDLKKFVENIRNSDERNGYVLMERIFPWAQKNHLLKVGKDPKLRDVISELGIFGVYLGSENEEIMNVEAGHLLRTKPQEDNDGGFLTGFATVDNPFLTEV